jgi:TrpR family trp operon transcriptional repressor
MNNRQINDLIRVFLKIKTREEMLDFLKGILTPKELEEIPMRLAIVKMLKKGITQEKIAKELKVGIGTVTRGSNEIKRGRFKNVE